VSNITNLVARGGGLIYSSPSYFRLPWWPNSNIIDGD